MFIVLKQNWSHDFPYCIHRYSYIASSVKVQAIPKLIWQPFGHCYPASPKPQSSLPAYITLTRKPRCIGLSNNNRINLSNIADSHPLLCVSYRQTSIGNTINRRRREPSFLQCPPTKFWIPTSTSGLQQPLPPKIMAG